MKKWLKKHIPNKQSIKKSPQLKRLEPYLKISFLWDFDRETVARGIAAGLAGCVIPGFQILYAALLALVFRGNLPIAIVATFITNPFTIIPIVYFIYFIGSLITGNGQKNYTFQHFHWDFSSFYAFGSNVSTWILQFGKGFLVGLPIVSISLAIIGYFGTIFIWKVWVFFTKKYKNKK